MIPNILTFSRIILSIVMLAFEVFSPGFYACYMLAGITDMLDGMLARKLGTCSEFGARLDTLSDFIFATIALYKILPRVELSTGIYIWIGVIAVIKITNVIFGFLAKESFVTVHSFANKITGFVLFVLPITIPFIEIEYSAVFACIIATYAAIQEGYYISNSIYEERRHGR